MDRYTLVLIHGSWHDGSAWSAVARSLRDRGHTVHNPTVAGHGKDADKTVTHDDGVRSIVDYIDDNGLDAFVLVGHSFGGTIISKVAERIPDRTQRLVFLNAFALQDGHSINDESPANYREMMRAMEADGTFMLPYPVWREVFIQDADEEAARAAYDTLSPEPLTMLDTQLDLSLFYKLVTDGELPCSYVNATEDTAMPHGEYAWHPRFSSRLGLCRVVQLPGSHEVLFTNPDLLATKLLEAARR